MAHVLFCWRQIPLPLPFIHRTFSFPYSLQTSQSNSASFGFVSQSFLSIANRSCFRPSPSIVYSEPLFHFGMKWKNFSEKSPFHRHKFNVQINPRRYLAIIFGLVCIYGAFMLFLAYRVAYVISPGKCVLSNEKNSKVNFMK